MVHSKSYTPDVEYTDLYEFTENEADTINAIRIASGDSVEEGQRLADFTMALLASSCEDQQGPVDNNTRMVWLDLVLHDLLEFEHPDQYNTSILAIILIGLGESTFQQLLRGCFEYPRFEELTTVEALTQQQIQKLTEELLNLEQLPKHAEFFVRTVAKAREEYPTEPYIYGPESSINLQNFLNYRIKQIIQFQQDSTVVEAKPGENGRITSKA